jgi:ATP-dependent Clp protease ATP-binding subunit ClpA
LFERLSETARHAVTLSLEEAARRGDRRVGTDHLLLGLLHDTAISKLLGVDLEGARTQRRVLDQEALVALGLEIGDFNPSVTLAKRKGTPFTSGAQSTLPRAFDLAKADKSRVVKPKHLLLALLEREDPDPVAVLLTRLRVDRSRVRMNMARL